MRQLNIGREKKKLRGVKRRLRALDYWADSAKGYFPSEDADEKYSNWKIPVYQGLVEPPTTNIAIQKHCIYALLRAANYFVEAKPKEMEHAIVTVLIPYPDMFSSEICVFFDQDYFVEFYQRNNEWQSLTPTTEPQLSSTLDFIVPAPFSEVGFHHKIQDKDEDEIFTFENEWWSYREKVIS